MHENLSRYTNQILKKSYVSLLSSSSYGDSLILSSMHSDVKIFTDKKVKGKQNLSDLSLLRLFKKNIVPRPHLALDQDGKAFISDLSSI